MPNGQDHTYPRAVLADDPQTVVEDLRGILEPERDVIATVGSGCVPVAAAETTPPDVTMTGIATQGLGGPAATDAILRRNSHARLVFVTVHDNSEMARKALATGVSGVVLKLTAGDELPDATHAAPPGVRRVSPLVRRGAT
jgi:DNA-binding NarL/FixJ family response regulator